MTLALPNLNLKQLRAIQTVARFSSFVAASVEMRMSQPGISRLISSAEAELGTELFHRNTRQVLMTPAGLQFLPTIDRILAEFDLAASALPRSHHRGHVIVACPISIANKMLAEIVAGFRTQHAEVTVEIREALRSDVINWIRFGIVDFGLASFMDEEDDLAIEFLCDVSYYVIVPRNHPFAGRKSVEFAELSGQPMISLPPTSIVRQTFDGAAARAGFGLNHAVTVSSPTTIFSLVENGVGVAIQNGASVRSHANGQFFACRILEPSLTSRIAAVRLKSRLMSAPARSFLQAVEEFFRKNPCT
jgi:LysR family carnitine catabolism transcriptional activator